MERYSPRSTLRFTLRRIIVRASPVPRARWTFWADRSGRAGCPPTSVRGCKRAAASVSTTNDLHRIVFRSAPRWIDRRDQDDDHRREKRSDVVAAAIAHEQAFGFHQPFDLDRQAAERFHGQLAEDQADDRSDETDY